MMRRTRISRSRGGWSIVAVAALAGAPQVARADDEVDDDDRPPSSAAHSLASGAFLPAALTATTEQRRGLVAFTAGWDGARHGAIYDTTAEAQLIGPISLSAGASDEGPGTMASPHVELRLDALHQRTHGVDLAIAGGYTHAGFNLVPAATFKLAVGRSVGPGYLLGNVVYGHGLDDGERFGELRLAALYPVTQAAQVGIDTRLQIDLERDASEPAGEADWESRTGVVASYAWNRLVLTSTAGVAALRLRSGGGTSVGPIVMGGLGTVF